MALVALSICAPGCGNGSDATNGPDATIVPDGTVICGQGACQRMVSPGLDGDPQVCVPGIPLLVDICGNGVDDNCDGQVDEECGASPPASGASYYVDSSCSVNGNGAGQTCAVSSGADGPFNSLAAAEAVLTGDRSDTGLYLKKGQTFQGQFTIEAHGSPGHPFTVSSYGTGSAPIITGGEHNIMTYCADCSDIVIEGLELTASTAERANVYILHPARRVTVRDCKIHHSSGNGILIYESSDNVVELNDVAWNPEFGVALIKNEFGEPTTGNVIRNNRVHHNLRYGIIAADWTGSSRLDGTTTELYGNEAYSNSTGIYLVHANGVKVFYNNLHDNGKDCQAVDDCPGEDYGFAIQSGSDNAIHDNLIVRSHSTGIGIYGGPGDTSDGNDVYRNIIAETIFGTWQHDIAWQAQQYTSVGSNNRVYGNLVFGDGDGFVLDDSDSMSSGNVAYNNVFSGGNHALVFEYANASAGWTFSNNIFVATSNPVFAGGVTGGLALLNNIYYRPEGGTLIEYDHAEYDAASISQLDRLAITADPQFVGASSWSELRLQPTSPAIDAATNLGEAEFGYAMDPQSTSWPPCLADQRGFGAAWEIGAFVYRDALP